MYKRTLLMGLTLLALAACEMVGETPVDRADLISGRVEAWPLGDAALIAMTSAPADSDAASYTSRELATGSLSAAGAVALQLPASVAADLVAPFEVALGADAGEVKVSPRGARFTPLLKALAVVQDGYTVASLRRAETHTQAQRVIARIYVTTDAQISGWYETSEADVTTRWEVELELQQGWNVVQVRYQHGASTGVSVALQNSVAPGAVPWEFALLNAR